MDIDRLISEIQNRPAIWNTKCREYNDRIDKIKQWEEIVNIFTGPFATVEEKRFQGRQIQKKWRTLRDAFVKQRREMALTDNGSIPSDKKTYKYYKQLMFLLPVVGSHNSTLNNEDSDSIDMPHSPNSSNVPPPPAKKVKRSDLVENVGRELVNALKSTLQQNNEEEDPDRQFMLSLVGDLKQVPPRLKSKVKMNILKSIIEAQDQAEESNKEQVQAEDVTLIIKNESGL